MKTSSYEVFLTENAADDLETLYDYIALNDSEENADKVFDEIKKRVQNLSRMPERGTYPKELLALGIREYREIFFKPYRIIYKIADDRVYVFLIADGRRDMQKLLLDRLLIYGVEHPRRQ